MILLNTKGTGKRGILKSNGIERMQKGTEKNTQRNETRSFCDGDSVAANDDVDGDGDGDGDDDGADAAATVLMLLLTSGRLSENIYTFTAEASDNKARFRCEASNVMSQTPLIAEVELAVLLYVPPKITTKLFK
uniref:Uncharacterized protein n=1 Tax=Glossina austeni TaxID=7395 RepID=A0A1A9VEL5_GLOAU